MHKDEWFRLAQQCTRFLVGHDRARLAPQAVFTQLAALTNPDTQADVYGTGELITGFENQVAELMGKAAAVFMPSGTMAQQIALRIWSDRHSSPHVAFHPTCHLEIHEQKAYQLLHGLHGVLIGSPYKLMTLDDLKQVKEPLAALLLELPQREIGGQLPTWDELVAITTWARERNIALHMDGARLWECQPFYQRSYAEIAGLFDTVYVSFYKILGGIAGAMLLGPQDIIDEARLWQKRHGGTLVQMYPFVLSAKHGLETRLDRMEQYHAKAIEIGDILKSFPQIEIMPNPPQTNMLHIFIRGDRDRLEEAAAQIAREQKIWLFRY
ncbi:MAG TPA: beta-eliminating lyase-related protein, partial [Anaerolineae bacterium]|nr:beta-eliminating lyase-related protein [Anaerolineae bacterium]